MVDVFLKYNEVCKYSIVIFCQKAILEYRKICYSRFL